MSLEAVKAIGDTEKKAEEMKEDAAARCKQLVQEAKETAQKTVAEARQRAEAEAEQARRIGEEKLALELREIADNAQNKKAVLRARAEKRLDEAAAMVAGRIVSI